MCSDIAKCCFNFETPHRKWSIHPDHPAGVIDVEAVSQPATEKQARIGKGTSWFVHVWNQEEKRPKTEEMWI